MARRDCRNDSDGELEYGEMIIDLKFLCWLDDGSCDKKWSTVWGPEDAAILLRYDENCLECEDGLLKLNMAIEMPCAILGTLAEL